MADNIISRVCAWNYVRNNIDYSPDMEYDMLYEEVEEYGVSRDAANSAKELADIIFVAIGSLYKLTGCNSSKTKEVIEAVIKHNENKSSKKDSRGKIKKVKQPKAEIKIKEILDI